MSNAAASVRRAVLVPGPRGVTRLADPWALGGSLAEWEVPWLDLRTETR